MVQFFFNFWWFNKGTWISSWSLIMFKRACQTMNWLLFLLFVCQLWSPTYCFLTTSIFSADYPYINYYVINKSREEAGQFYTDNKVFYSIQFCSILQILCRLSVMMNWMQASSVTTSPTPWTFTMRYNIIIIIANKKTWNKGEYKHQCQNDKNYTVRITVKMAENSVKRLKSTQKRLKWAPALKNKLH